MIPGTQNSRARALLPYFLLCPSATLAFCTPSPVKSCVAVLPRKRRLRSSAMPSGAGSGRSSVSSEKVRFRKSPLRLKAAVTDGGMRSRLLVGSADEFFR